MYLNYSAKCTTQTVEFRIEIPRGGVLQKDTCTNMEAGKQRERPGFTSAI